MEGAKQMLEGKLQDAGVQLMECERQLAEAVGSGNSAEGRSPKAGSGRRDSAAQVHPAVVPISLRAFLDPRAAEHAQGCLYAEWPI